MIYITCNEEEEEETKENLEKLLSLSLSIRLYKLFPAHSRFVLIFLAPPRLPFSKW